MFRLFLEVHRFSIHSSTFMIDWSACRWHLRAIHYHPDAVAHRQFSYEWCTWMHFSWAEQPFPSIEFPRPETKWSKFTVSISPSQTFAFYRIFYLPLRLVNSLETEFHECIRCLVPIHLERMHSDKPKMVTPHFPINRHMHSLQHQRCKPPDEYQIYFQYFSNIL